MNRLFLMLLLIVAVSFYAASAQETVTLEGKLIQGTKEGAALTPNLPLRLDILTPEGEVQASYNATSDAENNFVFPNVPRYTDESLYVLYTSWAGIEQSSLPFSLAEEVKPIEFPLYDTTSGLSEVVLYDGKLQVDFEDINAVGVQMLLEMNYTNLGDKIILPNGEEGVFTVELPVGALGIAPEEAPGAVQRFQPVNEVGAFFIPGIRDMQPLVPNWPNTMRVSFFVPYELGAVIDIRFPFSVDNMQIFVRKDTVYVDGESFSLTDQTETDSGKVYQIYEQTDALEPNLPFKFSLVGEPTQTVRKAVEPRNENDATTTILLIVVFASVGMIVLGAWLVYSRKAAV